VSWSYLPTNIRVALFSIKVAHLECDLKAWKPDCNTAMVGLKTEYECELVQDRCRNLQQASFSSICNDENYAMSDRKSVTGGGGTKFPGGGTKLDDSKTGAAGLAAFSFSSLVTLSIVLAAMLF
jgi:hypothetical protein